MKNVYLILLFLPLGLFAQKNKKVKIPLRLSLSFDYSKMKIGKETETEFIERVKNELNQKKEAKGDTFVSHWNEDKRALFVSAFIDGLDTKLYKSKPIYDTTGTIEGDFSIQVKTKYVRLGKIKDEFKQYPLHAVVKISHKNEVLYDSIIYVYNPQYKAGTIILGGVLFGALGAVAATVANGVQSGEMELIDSYYLAGKDTGDVLKRLIAERKRKKEED